jgi:hypothetical protein
MKGNRTFLVFLRTLRRASRCDTFPARSLAPPLDGTLIGVSSYNVAIGLERFRPPFTCCRRRGGRFTGGREMWEINPQQIPAGLNPAFFAALSGAMPWLVHDGRCGVNCESLRAWVSDALPGENGGAEGGGGVRGVRDCLHAALWLLEGDLDRAHRLCQEVPTALGSAWHAVVHRQEGDFWNSKYWWRRVGTGVNWAGLAADLRAIVPAAPGSIAGDLERLTRSYDPARFVDLVEMHRDNGEARPALLDVQRWEWAALFLETWNARG